jgi:hypothetical protein
VLEEWVKSLEQGTALKSPYLEIKDAIVQYMDLWDDPTFSEEPMQLGIAKGLEQEIKRLQGGAAGPANPANPPANPG